MMGIDARVFAAVDEYDQIEWISWQRWFDESYPRGHWPTIRTQITTLVEKFPDLTVYYMPDWADYFSRNEAWVVTRERLAQLDAYWEKFGNDQW